MCTQFATTIIQLLFASLKAQGPHLLDQTSCLALGHSLFILLLGNFFLLDVPRVGDTINGPTDNREFRGRDWHTGPNAPQETEPAAPVAPTR